MQQYLAIYNDYEKQKIVTTKKTTTICSTNVSVAAESAASQLSLRELLSLERQRREQSKQNFFNSSSTAPSSTTSLIYPTIPTYKYNSNGNEKRRRNLSQSSMSSLPRKQTVSNSEDEDVGILSGIDFSDENEFCDIEFHQKSNVRLKQREAAATSGIASDFSIEGACSSQDAGSDMDDDAFFQRGFYEISDTSGDISEVVDINLQNLNATTNLHYNNNNNKKNTSVGKNKKEHNLPLSATTIMGKKTSNDSSLKSVLSSTIATALDATHPSSRKIGATAKLKTMLTPTKSYSKVSSSPNSSDYSLTSPDTTTRSCQQQPSSVNQSKLFREPRQRLHLSSFEARSKKYARFFKRRRSKRSKSSLKAINSNKPNYNLNAISQNIKIIIQDEHGNYHPYDDSNDSLSCEGRRRFNPEASDDCEVDEENDEDDDEDNENILQRYLDNRLKPLSYHSVRQSDDISYCGYNRNQSQPPSDSKHVFGRFLKRMRRFSIGWRRPHYHKRRGDLFVYNF